MNLEVLSQKTVKEEQELEKNKKRRCKTADDELDERYTKT